MTVEAMESTEVVSSGLDYSLVYHPTTGNLSRRDQQSKLPGQPWVSLSSNKELLAYVRRNHGVSSLEWLGEKVGHFADMRGFPPLHAYGRAIALTEHPDLHFAKSSSSSSRGGEVVCFKPIPVYMLSTAFWAWLAAVDAKTHAAALGFMRTYCYLIRYEADFRLATERGLIPRIPPATDAAPPSGSSKSEQGPGDYRIGPDEASGGCRITYEGFVEFIAQFAQARVPNTAVAPRYRFSELRLHYSSPEFHRKLFLEPGEPQEKEQSSSSSSSNHKGSNDKAKKNEKTKTPEKPSSSAQGILLSLMVGIPLVWGWDKLPWALYFLFVPLGAINLFLLLLSLAGLFEWVLFDVIAPKDKRPIRPISRGGVPIQLSLDLVLGAVVVWQWRGPSSALGLFLMGLAFCIVVSLLVVAVQIYRWISGEWVPILEASKTAETKKEAQTETKERELLIEGLDMV